MKIQYLTPNILKNQCVNSFVNSVNCHVKKKGSSNRNKQRIKVALVHEKITNQRNDFLQKQSTMLIRENQTICIEDLNVI